MTLLDVCPKVESLPVDIDIDRSPSALVIKGLKWVYGEFISSETVGRGLAVSSKNQWTFPKQPSPEIFHVHFLS
jgi:hypothetical protein